MIYLLCFERPLHHARHYLGYTRDGESLESRLEDHRSGRGARLLAVLKEHGIGWQLVRTWEGGRTEERRLKKWHGSGRLCPLCNQKLTKREEIHENAV